MALGRFEQQQFGTASVEGVKYLLYVYGTGWTEERYA